MTVSAFSFPSFVSLSSTFVIGDPGQKFLDADEAATIVENFGTRAHIVHDSPHVTVSPDSMDNAILAAAIAGKVDLIVSGDKKHVAMEKRGKSEGLQIQTEALPFILTPSKNQC